VNRGLFIKSLRELAPPTLLLGGALFLVHMVMQIILPRVAEQARGQMMQMPFAQNIIKAMLGTETMPEAGPRLFLSIPWAHPVVMALVWAHAIIGATRLPAGEVDRGTIDILLGMPVSRWRLFVTDSAAWALCGAAVLLAGLAGNQVGAMTVSPEQRAQVPRLLMVLVNLWTFYAAVGGLAWLMSALSDRRGKAMTGAFVFVLASFLLNYLAQLWEPMERLGFLSALRYYRPLFILNDGAWPGRDVAVLGASAAVLWGAAGVAFARRDLSTI
jgi:ABC-2 type transport system permease protein